MSSDHVREPSSSNHDNRSPVLSPHLAHANIPLTRNGAHTPSANGRTRHSWRDGRIFDLPAGDTADRYRVSSTVHKLHQSQDLNHQPAQLDHLRSFFDSASSDSDSEEAAAAEHVVINRASSVRVQRPRIVHHHSSVVADNTATNNEQLDTTDHPGPWLGEPSQTVNRPIDRTPNMSPTSTDGGPTAFIRVAPKLKICPVAPITDASAEPLPTPISERAVQALVVEIPDTSTRTEALDTQPTPLRGFGSLPNPPLAIRNGTLATHSRVDGLRCNPIIAETSLSRARSAPSQPSAGVVEQRRVTIRPSDLINDNGWTPHHRRVRENIVSTPYPLDNIDEKNHEGELAVAKVANTSRHGRTLECIPSVTVATSASKETPLTDRFPSPGRGETLFLEMALGGHEDARRCVVEVSIEDKDTFDDEALFGVIVTQFSRNLLGVIRCTLLAVKTLDSVTSTTMQKSDRAGFVELFRKPKLGRRRKRWVVWLRRYQQPPLQPSSANGVDAVKTSSPPESHVGHRSQYPATQPLQQDGCPGGPTVVFHFRPRASGIIIVASMVIFLSCLTTILWTVFDVPGRNAGLMATAETRPATAAGGSLTQASQEAESSTVQLDLLPQVGTWHSDAQQRVLTGAVLGILVFLLGSMGAGVWVVGSRLLL